MTALIPRIAPHADPHSAARVAPAARATGALLPRATPTRPRVEVRPYTSIEDVVRVIAGLAIEAMHDPGLVRLARPLTHAAGVLQWMQRHLAYVRDTPGVEDIQAAPVTLDRQAGDCEDLTILAVALLYALGYDVRLVIVQAHDAPTWNHIFAEYYDGGQWHVFDATVPGAAAFVLDDRTYRRVWRVPLTVQDTATAATAATGLAGDENTPHVAFDRFKLWVTDVTATDNQLQLEMLIQSSQKAWIGRCADWVIALRDDRDTLVLVDEVITRFATGWDYQCKYEGRLVATTFPQRAHRIEVYPADTTRADIEAGLAPLAVSLYRSWTDGAESAPDGGLFDDVREASREAGALLAATAKLAVGGVALYLAWPLLDNLRSRVDA